MLRNWVNPITPTPPQTPLQSVSIPSYTPLPDTKQTMVQTAQAYLPLLLFFEVDQEKQGKN